MKKKGGIGGKGTTILSAIIGVIVLFAFAQYGYPYIAYALGNLTSSLSGWPLIGLFGTTGLLALLAMAALFYAGYKMFANMGGR